MHQPYCTPSSVAPHLYQSRDQAMEDIDALVLRQSDEAYIRLRSASRDLMVAAVDYLVPTAGGQWRRYYCRDAAERQEAIDELTAAWLQCLPLAHQYTDTETSSQLLAAVVAKARWTAWSQIRRRLRQRRRELLTAEPLDPEAIANCEDLADRVASREQAKVIRKVIVQYLKQQRSDDRLILLTSLSRVLNIGGWAGAALTDEELADVLSVSCRTIQRRRQTLLEPLRQEIEEILVA